MTNLPAINTTVHYTAGDPPGCHDARVREHLDDAGELYLEVPYNGPYGRFHVAVATIPDPNPDQRTPGYWHPWHEEQQ